MSCCEDPGCSHIVLAAATLEATKLTDKEREMILGVLTKDEQIRRQQHLRIMHLKAELQALRRKGALKASADWDSTGPDPDRSCGRCRVELGRVINRGAYCRACRLKVCKGCREYSTRTTDWVCTVCHKHMEIQTASGEWMNEFVRRPSRRRDNKVYVPAADIIKRTIRRSWTISNPTPRWGVLRGSVEMRPYHSLPRGQDVADYPALAIHRTNLKNSELSDGIITKTRSPARRTQSEDVYNERRNASEEKENEIEEQVAVKTDSNPVQQGQLGRQQRVHPLVVFAENKTSQERKSSPRRSNKKNESHSKNAENKEICIKESQETEKSTVEKRVSFETNISTGTNEIIRTHLLPEGKPKGNLITTDTNFFPEEQTMSNTECHKDEDKIELCDIEPFSGTVFRKVTVRRRRQENMRKMAAVDAGRRNQENDLFDILVPDVEDYKLVFLSSDSSSKEEDVDDNDSSSASSFPIDECDWDYFEPGATRHVLNWNSPFGSPSVYRRTVGESPVGSPSVRRRESSDEDITDVLYPKPLTTPTQQCVHLAAPQVPEPTQPCCTSCGATTTQYIPIPVPVPIPFPVPTMWNPDESAVARYIQRDVWQYYQLPFVWPQSHVASATGTMPEEPEPEPSGHLECENGDSSSSSDEEKPTSRVYNINGTQRDSDDALSISDAEEPSQSSVPDEEEEDDDVSSSSGTEGNTDSDDTGTVADRKPKRFSRVFVVNKNGSSSSGEDGTGGSGTTSSDNDTDTEIVVLTNVRSLEASAANVDGEMAREAGEVAAVGEQHLKEGDSGEDEDGVPVLSECGARHVAGRYTSLVMITQEPATSYHNDRAVSVVPTGATTVIVGENVSVDVGDVVVSHTNSREDENEEGNGEDGGRKCDGNDTQNHSESDNVTVITGAETLSAFEEGLADDDSWVENLSHDEDDFVTNSPSSDDSSSGEEVTLTCSAAIDQEDELRGYHRAAIDFTLHTIVEESCEESEVEPATHTSNNNTRSKKERPASATDLEKYFFFGLGDGTPASMASNKEDAFSETSSIYSEGMDSLGGPEENGNNAIMDNPNDPEQLASSRLEKYFLSSFMGFTAERKDSDGSVGSDSEGRPSPEQRRKRLVRARGTGRSHSSSLDNLLANPDLNSGEQNGDTPNSEDSSSSDSDTYDEIASLDGQFDTVKRKKCKKPKNLAEDTKPLETTQETNEDNDLEEEKDGQKTPQPELTCDLTATKNHQSRDSGFIGSNDDLLKDQKENSTPVSIQGKTEPRTDLERIAEERKIEEKTSLGPPVTSLTRKDSFNNWSSDEETNLMMSKMRQFFKTMVATSQGASKPLTPNIGALVSPVPRSKNRCKPPQLVYFENELTRLMKTVPGIREDQVREIVEYLSSEDTWSDSYDSSDYTSSDLEGTTTKSALQQQISDSCKQIINKFDTTTVEDEEGDLGDGGIVDDSCGLSRETAFVYQKLVASFERMATGDSTTPVPPNIRNSPPLIAKVMHHIGSRLVALMHEVSSGESHKSTSPKARHYHRRLQQKLSNASSTTTDDDSTSDSNLPDTFLEETSYSILPRSKSHDLLMSEARNLHQSGGGASDVAEEREASDCERFSWRGSFESALLATDSRNKLFMERENSASASALAVAAKRRSAGDLLFSPKSLSREQLDRVRSCGSISGTAASGEEKLWVATTSKSNRRRSSVPDASSGGSADGGDEEEQLENNRATLPRSIQSGPATTNSLPRLPTSSATGGMQKAQSMCHFLPQSSAKSARYRPPGLNRLLTTVPKRAVSAPGLQPSHQRRGRRSHQQNVPIDDVSISEAHSSPMLASRGSKSATPSPVAHGARRVTSTSVSSQEWQSNEDDIDRLVNIHHTRSSLGSLGMRSDSMASVYSGAGEGRYGTVTVRGQVEFGLQYNYKAGALEIQIKQCKDLAPVDTKRNRSDPYVKVYLLPDKSKSGKRKTKVKKHTLNPVFDESLKFHISLNGLETRTLWLTVWHSDMFGRNDFLGEVMMALENKVFDDPTPKWYNLQERTEPFDDILSFKGDIIVCLKFVPPDMTVHKKGKRSRGTLHVLVKEAKALTAVKANGMSDPFCKSYLLPDKGRSSKQKTPVVRRTVNPVWNHTFVYDDVTLQELAERCLELTVWDHDRLASNEFLGGVRFSLGTGKHYGKPVEWMDATGKEVSLWKSMLERPNFWVEGCLPLRPSLDSRAS